MPCRRSFLVGLVAALAGCATSESDRADSLPSTAAQPTGTRPATTSTATQTPDSTATQTPASTESSLPAHAPRVTFEFAWDPSARELTVTHAGGDAITDAATSSMTFDREDEGTLVFWVADKEAFRRTALGEYPVTAGDSITRSVKPGEHVAVTWFDSEKQGYVLGEYHVPT